VTTLPINQPHLAGWLAHNPKQYVVNGTWESTGETPTGSACTVNAILRNQYNTGQDGIVGEIIVVDGISTIENRQKIEGYLAHKWGLTGNLPSNHPYKTKKPQRTSLWTPSKITTAGWWDASDTSTITHVGGAVSQLNDKSGNNNHAVQGVGANQPALVTTQFSGRQTIQFEADNDDHLDVPNHASLNFDATGLSMFMVLRKGLFLNQGSGVNAFMSKGDAVTASQSYKIRMSGGGISTEIMGGSDFTVNKVDTDTPTIYLINSVTTPGVQHEGWINGTSLGVDNTGAGLSDNIDPLRIGGDPGSSSRFASMHFAELVLVPTVMSTADRQKMEGYLAWKWGFNHQLPDTHPYKRRPPMA